MDDIIFEAAETVGEQKKRAVVMVGRMNPPTRGHYKVMNAMKAFIRDNPDYNLDAQPIVVIVDGKKTSEDKTKNPLTADERKTFMANSGRANGVIFLTAGSAFDAFEAVRRAGFEPTAVAAGSDRAANYLKMLDKYFKSKDDKPLTHHKVPGLERDEDDDHEDGINAFDKILDALEAGDEVPDSMISGSLARHAVTKGKKKAFAYVVGMEKKQALADKMFAKLASAMKE